MAANTSPIFPLTPNIGFVALTTVDATASKNHDGTGTGTALLVTAGTNGTRVDQVIATPKGTNAASVLRVYINNGSANTTAANNILIGEVALPATSISETAAQTTQTIPVNCSIPTGYRIYATLGTAVAAGWAVCCQAGDY